MWKLALVAALFLDGTPHWQDQELVLRSYSLLSLSGQRGFSTDVMSMLPYVWQSDADSFFDLEDEEHPPVEPEEIVNLVRECVYPAYWDEVEWVLDVVNDRLWVTAPPAVHREIVEMLTYLQEVYGTGGHVAVHVYEGSVPDAALRMTTAEADRRLATLTAAGQLVLRRAGRVAATPGLVQKLDSATIATYPFDWEHEVAQGAFIGQPVLLPIAQGLNASLKAVPAAGGTQLDLLLRESEAVAPPDVRNIRTPSTLNAKSGMLDFGHGVSSSIGRVEHPRLGFTSFAGTLFLPDGQAVWIHTTLQTQSGPVQYLIDVRHEGPAQAVERRFAYEWRSPDEEDGEAPLAMTLAAMHVGASTTGGVEVPFPSVELFDPDGSAGWAAEWIAAVIDPGAGHNPIYSDHLTQVLYGDGERYDSDPRYTIHWADPVVLLTGDSAHIDEQVEPARRFTHSATTFQVRGRLLGNDGVELGRFQVASLESRPLALWSGVQSMGISDWDVDVANEAMVATPDFLAVIDGYALRLQVDPLPDGAHRLWLRGKLNLLEAPAVDVALTQTGIEYTRARSHALYIEDSVTLDHLDAPGTTLRFGDATLTLELTVSALP